MCRSNAIPPEEAQAGEAAWAEALAALAAMPAHLARLAAAVPGAERQRRASDGNFSLAEHLCHLRDIEIEGYRLRLERLLSESEPLLADLDGARLARERQYHRQDALTALAAFAAVRADLLSRLRGLVAQERQRRGRMEGAGAITVEGLVQMMRAHDAEHRADLARLCRELGVEP